MSATMCDAKSHNKPWLPAHIFTVLPFLFPKIIKIETSTVQLLLEQSPYFKVMRKRRITTN
jgi:hypothetical protein